jgi:hypothetical protein
LPRISVAEVANFALVTTANAASQCIPKVCKVLAVATFGMKRVPTSPRLVKPLPRIHLGRVTWPKGKLPWRVAEVTATSTRSLRSGRDHGWALSENAPRSASPWRPEHERGRNELRFDRVVAIHQSADKLSRSM